MHPSAKMITEPVTNTNRPTHRQTKASGAAVAVAAVNDMVVLGNGIFKDITIYKRWKVEALIAIRFIWIYVYMCGWICVPTLFSWQHGGVGGRSDDGAEGVPQGPEGHDQTVQRASLLPNVHI